MPQPMELNNNADVCLPTRVKTFPIRQPTNRVAAPQAMKMQYDQNRLLLPIIIGPNDIDTATNSVRKARCKIRN